MIGDCVIIIVEMLVYLLVLLMKMVLLQSLVVLKYMIRYWPAMEKTLHKKLMESKTKI